MSGSLTTWMPAEVIRSGVCFRVKPVKKLTQIDIYCAYQKVLQPFLLFGESVELPISNRDVLNQLQVLCRNDSRRNKIVFFDGDKLGSTKEFVLIFFVDREVKMFFLAPYGAIAVRPPRKKR